MGALIRAREDKFPPLEIDGRNLRPVDYVLPVPSAQVKPCVLFAGLFADGLTSVTEPVRSRDHTELALREFGADLVVAQRKIMLTGRPRLTGRELVVPSDLSSAAFFIVAGVVLLPGRSLPSASGAEPTRAALLDFWRHGRQITFDLETRNGS
jgi:3-phosphoshikimate 1-carboxyvinyltransferase